jgi:hypothetical protein
MRFVRFERLALIDGSFGFLFGIVTPINIGLDIENSPTGGYLEGWGPGPSPH